LCDQRMWHCLLPIKSVGSMLAAGSQIIYVKRGPEIMYYNTKI
jgi:hypothetical protein